ncbi:hypothetical protein [Nonomuraea sp. LPB2021202275-12-8]|uniref:hypothetical protein n=1 Tax=Nonomuraea sp. LPB2021202275-12-8 TaxID=3120159 RepID=UPI00300CD58B
MSAVLFLLGGAVPIAMAGAAIYPLSAAQITWTLITVVALIIAAFLSVRFRRPLLPATPPSPWTVFAITIAAGLAFWLPSLLAMVGIKLESIVPAWITVGFYLTLYATMTLLILSWSRCMGWGPWHRFALGAAGLVAYAWHGFPQPPSSTLLAAARLGHVIRYIAPGRCTDVATGMRAAPKITALRGGRSPLAAAAFLAMPRRSQRAYASAMARLRRTPGHAFGATCLQSRSTCLTCLTRSYRSDLREEVKNLR